MFYFRTADYYNCRIEELSKQWDSTEGVVNKITYSTHPDITFSSFFSYLNQPQFAQSGQLNPLKKAVQLKIQQMPTQVKPAVDRHSQAESQIFSLPTELLSHISFFLPMQSILVMCSTCKLAAKQFGSCLSNSSDKLSDFIWKSLRNRKTCQLICDYLTTINSEKVTPWELVISDQTDISTLEKVCQKFPHCKKFVNCAKNLSIEQAKKIVSLLPNVERVELFFGENWLSEVEWPSSTRELHLHNLFNEESLNKLFLKMTGLEEIHFMDRYAWQTLLSLTYPKKLQRLNAHFIISYFEKKTFHTLEWCISHTAPNNALPKMYLAELLINGPVKDLARAHTLLDEAHALMPNLEKEKILRLKLEEQIQKSASAHNWSSEKLSSFFTDNINSPDGEKIILTFLQPTKESIYTTHWKLTLSKPWKGQLELLKKCLASFPELTEISFEDEWKCFADIEQALISPALKKIVVPAGNFSWLQFPDTIEELQIVGLVHPTDLQSVGESFRKLKKLSFTIPSGGKQLYETLIATYPLTLEELDLLENIQVDNIEHESYCIFAYKTCKTLEDTEHLKYQKNAVARTYLAHYLVYGPEKDLTRATVLLQEAIEIMPALKKARELLQYIKSIVSAR